MKTIARGVCVCVWIVVLFFCFLFVLPFLVGPPPRALIGRRRVAGVV